MKILRHTLSCLLATPLLFGPPKAKDRGLACLPARASWVDYFYCLLLYGKSQLSLTVLSYNRSSNGDNANSFLSNVCTPLCLCDQNIANHTKYNDIL